MPPFCDGEGSDDEEGESPRQRVCDKRWCHAERRCVCYAWSVESQYLTAEWSLGRHRGSKRLWENNVSVSGCARWAKIPHERRREFACQYAPDVQTMLRQPNFKTLATRLNGGWEKFLIDTPGVQCSLLTTPFASPTSLFQSSPQCPRQLGVLGDDLNQYSYGALCLSLSSPMSPRAECRTPGASLPLASPLPLTVGVASYNQLWQDVDLAVAIFQAATRGAATGTAFDVSAAQA